jgi:hypothetical protein
MLTHAFVYRQLGLVEMSRKRLNLILGVVVLAALAYWFYPFVVGGPNMKAFCGTLKVTMTREDVERAVSDEGFRLSLGKERKGFVHDPRAFGRFICEVNFEGDRLVSAEYFVND